MRSFSAVGVPCIKKMSRGHKRNTSKREYDICSYPSENGQMNGSVPTSYYKTQLASGEQDMRR